MKTLSLYFACFAIVLLFGLANLSANDTIKEKILQLYPEADNIFSTDEIFDESTLEPKTLEDWHIDTITGTTRQKLVEINVAQWWPGQDYRIPVRLIVPLVGKAKGFSITGANPYETLMEDSQPTDFQAKLLAGGVASSRRTSRRSGRFRANRAWSKKCSACL